MTRQACALGLIGIACLSTLPACDRAGNAGAPAGPASIVSAGAVSLEVRADRDEIRAADRLTVTVRAQGERGMELDPPVLDAEASRWTVVSQSGGVLRVEPAGRVSREITLELEPFLEGAYEIPPATVSYRDASGSPGVLATEAFEIEVVSVLAAGAAEELAAPRAVVSPPTEPHRPAWVVPVTVSAGAIVLGAGVGVLLMQKRPGAPRERSALDRLALLAADDRADATQTYDAIAAAFDASASSRQRDAAAPLVRECERVRFGGATPEPERARAAAGEALDLLSRGGAA